MWMHHNQLIHWPVDGIVSFLVWDFYDNAAMKFACRSLYGQKLPLLSGRVLREGLLGPMVSAGLPS